MISRLYSLENLCSMVSLQGRDVSAVDQEQIRELFRRSCRSCRIAASVQTRKAEDSQEVTGLPKLEPARNSRDAVRIKLIVVNYLFTTLDSLVKLIDRARAPWGTPKTGQ